MKKCPLRADDLPDAASRRTPDTDILPPPLPAPGRPWIFRTSSIVIALCNFPPLALPMIWARPHATLAWKIGMTFVVLFSTLALGWLLYVTYLVLLTVSRQIIILMNLV